MTPHPSPPAQRTEARFRSLHSTNGDKNEPQFSGRPRAIPATLPHPKNQHNGRKSFYRNWSPRQVSEVVKFDEAMNIASAP